MKSSDFLSLVIGLTFAAAVTASSAAAQEACMQQGHQAAASYQDNDPDLAATVRQAWELKKAGLDPSHYIVEDDSKYTVLSVKLHELAVRSAAKLESSDVCDEKMMPFREMGDVR